MTTKVADYEATYPNPTDWPGVVFEPGGTLGPTYAGSIWAPMRTQGFGYGHEYLPPTGPALGYLGGDSDFFAGSDPWTSADFTVTFTADIPNMDYLEAYNPEDPGAGHYATFTRAEVAAGAVWAYTYGSDGVSRPLDVFNPVEFFLWMASAATTPTFITVHTTVKWSNDKQRTGWTIGSVSMVGT